MEVEKRYCSVPLQEWCFKCHKKGHKASDSKPKNGASKGESLAESAIIAVKLDTKQMIVGTKRRTKASIKPGTSPAKMEEDGCYCS